MKGILPMSAPIEIFKRLCEIPRGSGNEKGVADWLEDFAREHSLEFYRDSEQNVLIRRDGNGCGVVLQGHSDMVCEKNADVTHDFEREPIDTVLKNGHLLSANGTTLGADDGISIAVMLAILADTEPTVPVECLITSKEEIGLLGMQSFDLSLLRGRTMINLDSMDEGVATVSCCGGVRTDIGLDVLRTPVCGSGYTLRIRGLAGGHSGEDINLGRRNAILTALEIIRQADDVRFYSIDGGSKDNAIPRECTVVFSSSDPECVSKLEKKAEEIRRVITTDDSAFSAVLEPTEVGTAFGSEFTEALYRLIDAIPLGVIRMNAQIEGLVHTSANLGVICTSDSGVSVTVSSRSSDEKVLEELIRTADRTAAECNAHASHRGRYRGWDFEEDSKVRELYLTVYNELFAHLGKKARYEGIHAGLECGIVKAAIPDMDIISIGADIKACHSPDETLDVDSLERLYLTVAEMIRRMAV